MKLLSEVSCHLSGCFRTWWTY